MSMKMNTGSTVTALCHSLSFSHSIVSLEIFLLSEIFLIIIIFIAVSPSRISTNENRNLNFLSYHSVLFNKSAWDIVSTQ